MDIASFDIETLNPSKIIKTILDRQRVVIGYPYMTLYIGFCIGESKTPVENSVNLLGTSQPYSFEVIQHGNEQPLIINAPPGIYHITIKFRHIDPDSVKSVAQSMRLIRSALKTCYAIPLGISVVDIPTDSSDIFKREFM